MHQLKRKKGALNYQSRKKTNGIADSRELPCEAKVRISKSLPRLKVYYKVGFDKDIPVILLQGEWIRNLGFNVQDQIVVSGELGRLEVRLEK